MMRRILSVVGIFSLVFTTLLPQATVLATTPAPGCPQIDWKPPADCYTDPTGEPGIGTDYSDLVGTESHPAAFYAFDLSTTGYAHFRERVVANPVTSRGFRNAAWVVLLDFDSTPGYDYLIGLSGKNPEVVSLYSNPVGSRQIPFIFDPTNVDKAEDRLGSALSAASYASSSIDDTGHYWFVDWWFPMQSLIQYLPEIAHPQDFDQLIAEGHLHLYFGTAEDNNNYNKDVLKCATPAMLTVCKDVVNNDGGTATAHDWDIVILNEDDQEVARQTPESDEANCVSFALAGGTYKIVEDGPEGYVATYSGDSTDGTITLEPFEEASVTITNDDIPGSSSGALLTLHKTVVNDNGGTLTESDFQAYLDGSPVNWDEAFVVGAGPHTVSESAAPGYVASDWSGDCDTGGNLTAVLGQEYDCYVSNDDQPATLTVCKEIVINHGGIATVPDFTFVISDDEGNEVDSATPASEENNCVEFTLDAGTYTISEEGPGGYAPTFSVDTADGTITLGPGDDKYVLVTNNDFDPTITVCKVLVNNDSGQAAINDFRFKLTSSQGQVYGPLTPTEEVPCVTFTVPMGSYTITEEGPDGYIATFSGDSTDGNLSVVLGDHKTVTVRNDDVSRYSISGHKYCCGDEGCTGTGIEGWEITLVGPTEDESPAQQTTLTNSAGYYVFTDLVPGTYIVSETPVDDWRNCTPDSVQIVVAAGSGAIYSTPGETEYYDDGTHTWLPAVAAWEPDNNTDPSYWDTSLTGHSFTSDADWIWSSFRTAHPVSGDVVDFRQQFTVPGTPSDGDLWITVDNGYEVYLNGTFLGSAQVHNYQGVDWQDSSLRESWVNAHGWESVEHYDVSPYLVSGINTLIIEAANEYMGPNDPGQVNGTTSTNPAGAIFELTYSTEPTDEYVANFCNSPDAVASSNSPVCPGSDIEFFGGPDGMATYSWTGPNNFSSNDQNPVISGATEDMEGEYTLTVTTDSGCSASDSVDITVNEAPVAGDDFSLCASASPEALGGSPAGGTWTGTGVQSDGDDGYEFSPSGLGGDSYTLTYTDENGCSDTLTATVYASPNAGDDFSLCASASPEALGGSPAGGTWTGTGVQSDGDDGYEFSPSGLGGDSYTLTYTDENGCSDTLLATVYASPNAGDDFSLCASASPEALGGSPAGGTWTGTGVQSDGDDGYEFNPSGLGGDSYTLTYTDENGCSDTLLATVYASPNAGDDFSLCASASPEALGGSPAGGTWTGTGVQSDGDDGYEFNPSGLGGDSYTLTYTDENGCSDTLLATVYASPNAGDDFSLCASASPEALGGSPAGGTWTGTGVQSDGDDGYEFRPLRPRRRLLHPHLYRRERLLRYPHRHRLRQPQRGR